MRIGIDGRFWDESGVGRYIRNLVRVLQKIDKKNEYVLFVRSKDYEAVKCQMTNDRWQIISVDIHWHSLREQIEFPKVLAKENLDLMHFPYFSVPIYYKGAYVVTIHDLILHHFATGEATTLSLPLYKLKLQGYKYVISHAAKNARKVIAVSHATKDEIVDHLHIPEDKIVVTYEGVDQQVLKPKNQRPMTNGKYFLHVGNVYPHKNAKRLVDAFEKAAISNVKLLFVGKKDHFMARLEEYVKVKQLQANILFLGFITDDELASLYKHACATVVPSLMEGFGLPVLEAMSQGSLVVASDIPSLREVAGEAALYVDPLNTQEIGAIMHTIAESERAEFNGLREKGTKLVASFTWEHMAQQTLAVYESSFSLRSS